MGSQHGGRKSAVSAEVTHPFLRFRLFMTRSNMTVESSPAHKCFITLFTFELVPDTVSRPSVVFQILSAFIRLSTIRAEKCFLPRIVTVKMVSKKFPRFLQLQADYADFRIWQMMLHVMRVELPLVLQLFAAFRTLDFFIQRFPVSVNLLLYMLIENLPVLTRFQANGANLVKLVADTDIVVDEEMPRNTMKLEIR